MSNAILQSKLDTYLKAKKGFVLPFDKNLKKEVLTILLPAAAIGTGYAQCLGPDMNIQNRGFAGAGTANGIGLDVDGDNVNDLLFYLGTQFATNAGVNSLKVRILVGTVFVTNNAVALASAIAYGNNAQIDGDFDANNNVRPAPGFAYLAYAVNGTKGNLKTGTTANIGYRKGGKFGFVTLTTSYVGGGLPWRITVSERGIDNASDPSISAGNCNTLPVELSAFKAEAKENTIALLWETASEINNAGFEVERSENGKTFKAISFVEGKGTTVETNRYSFTDATAQKGKNYYYRLKQVDFDGSFEYSQIVTAQINTGKEVQATLTPNPSQQGITQLRYVAIEKGSLAVSVYDVVGKQLYDQQFEVATGENTVSLNLDNLAKGVYFVKLTQGDYKTYEQLIIELRMKNGK